MDFSRDGLDESDLDVNPYRQFEKWYQEAADDGIGSPNAMSLATASADGQPTVRTVLLKLFDEDGFVFFTNYGSTKAKQITENPKAALLFPWIMQGRQVIVTGAVAKISTRESLSYFLSRPRGSQIGAWASQQSEIISSRVVLEKSVNQVVERFRNRKIPLPDFWGGYRVMPEIIEFWQGRKDRLHDRFQYHRHGEDHEWVVNRVSP
ncbi:MAG: pyridoxine/pyridoxamine 5'-phosphate oxidase [marine bacterium B5-7]|nr:MAG: pyridoxine/pyridoxamine 5'-phosphate oxidase [marine bacterium B5-7]